VSDLRATSDRAAASPRGQRRSAAGEGVLARFGPPLAVLAGVIGLWYLLAYRVVTRDNDLGHFLLPPPHQVWSKGFVDPAARGEIFSGFLNTAVVALVGLAIAIVVGVAIAVVMSQARWVERALYPYLVVVQTIPIIATVPLVGLALERSFRAKVVATVIIAIFPIITNTLFGLRSAEPGHHDLFTLHGAGRLVRLKSLMVPASLPAVFTGFRISAGLSVIGALVGDFFFRQGDKGLGQLLQIYFTNLQPERLYASVMWSSLLGIAMLWGFGLLGALATRSWYEPTGGAGR
jgi:NitT/TauT family transport system permease protein